MGPNKDRVTKREKRGRERAREWERARERDKWLPVTTDNHLAMNEQFVCCASLQVGFPGVTIVCNFPQMCVTAAPKQWNVYAFDFIT